MKRLMAIVLCLPTMWLFAAELYKWQDEKGNWHYSDKSPVDQKVEKEEAKEVQPVEWQETPDTKKLRKVRTENRNDRVSNKAYECKRSKLKSESNNKQLKRGTSYDTDRLKKELRDERWQQLKKNC